ncbi:ABC transporter permease [Luteolibacter pohnpeiensis]|uniref:ABC transporter permease n=1 Tax=Luteolibacter pohnpeiensis TaxID=454153 RepID=A0A934SAK3_9BACT|nr:ABC transporter permease [Luteolibacter pohnpeiensis]MBK1883936.1 ABC transporter permease [Luteolibacter pohnpeiensis]
MLLNAFLIAIREIRRNLTRAFLTVLGVVIGVAAVITMVTLGRGATASVKEQISSLGSNLLVLRPGQGFGPRGPSAGVPLFTESDAEAIDEQVAGIQAVAPVVSTSVSTIYLQEARTGNVTGTTQEYFEIGNWSLKEGRYFDDEEIKTGAAVAVIGETVRKELFGSADPIGSKIRLKNTSVVVIGLLNSKGQTGFGNDQDDTVVMPISTLQRRLVGLVSKQNVNQVMISGKDGYPSAVLVSDITALMQERRHIRKGMSDNFSVFDTRQIADAVSSSTQVMTTLLAAVAGVSLLVGGIGIMNIMLVSVTERTREIGIRLAIGARAREVLLQFLVEAVTLSCVGGLSGITLAYTMCVILSKVISVPFTFDPTINLYAFVFSAGIGIFFGFMPARRAAALDPIDALRHE